MALAVGVWEKNKSMPKFFKSLNPYTQEIVGEYMEASGIQIEVKLEWAQMVQRDWAARSFSDRATCFAPARTRGAQILQGGNSRQAAIVFWSTIRASPGIP